MPSNYPPGVSGNEYKIAGPDYERETDETCAQNEKFGFVYGEANYCPGYMFEYGYRGQRWMVCSECEYTVDLEPLEVSRYDTDPRV